MRTIQVRYYGHNIALKPSLGRSATSDSVSLLVIGHVVKVWGCGRLETTMSGGARPNMATLLIEGSR